jgi:hypothetical protein
LRGGGSREGQGPRGEGRDQDRGWDQLAVGAKSDSRFPKPDHPVSSASGQKKPSKTTTPGTALAPHWCPQGLTPSQRRRIQLMRAQKVREEAAEKERDEHFNDI